MRSVHVWSRARLMLTCVVSGMARVRSTTISVPAGLRGAIARMQTIIPSEREAITHAVKNAVKGSLIILCSDVIPDALDLVKDFKEKEAKGELIFAD